MKVDFSKVIFMDKSWVMFDGLDGWTKGWILSTSAMFVANKKKGKQEMVVRGSVIIIDQIITGPL